MPIDDKAVQTRDEAGIAVPVEPPAPYQGEDWDTLTQESATVFGADLEKGNALIGVPFVIVRITIRLGDYTHKDCGAAHPYASMDVIIAPEPLLEKALRRNRITTEQYETFDPMEHLVFNEAGTGAYRSALAFLESQNVLILPDGPDAGSFGESRYDSLPDAWEFPTESYSPVASKAQVTRNDKGEPIVFWDCRLRCPRGLRVSEYQNDYTKEGRTRYFA